MQITKCQRRNTHQAI